MEFVAFNGNDHVNGLTLTTPSVTAVRDSPSTDQCMPTVLSVTDSGYIGSMRIQLVSQLLNCNVSLG